MENLITTTLLSVIVALLGVIASYIKKMVDRFDVLRDKVTEHDYKIKMIEEHIK